MGFTLWLFVTSENGDVPWVLMGFHGDLMEIPGLVMTVTVRHGSHGP